MSDEISKLPPRAFGSIVDAYKALRGEDGMVQSDILTASALLQHIEPALSERLRKISVAQQAALAKSEGR
jgi:hypothetical protein